MAYEEGDEVNFPMPLSKKWIGWGILGIVLIIILVSIFYTIGPEQVGVIKRWGRFVRTTEPGLHFKIPFAETVTKVRVKGSLALGLCEPGWKLYMRRVALKKSL